MPETFICLYTGDGDECANCGGWAGPDAIVLHAPEDGPVGGRFCKSECAVEAIELAVTDAEKFDQAWASERAGNTAWYDQYRAEQPGHDAELAAWNARTDIDWAVK